MWWVQHIGPWMTIVRTNCFSRMVLIGATIAVISSVPVGTGIFLSYRGDAASAALVALVQSAAFLVVYVGGRRHGHLRHIVVRRPCWLGVMAP